MLRFTNLVSRKSCLLIVLYLSVKLSCPLGALAQETSKGQNVTTAKDTAKTPVTRIVEDKTPFEDIDSRWQNGSDRRDSSVLTGNKYFTPSLMLDMNYTHSFNRPNDNTVVGSTALARNNEVSLSAMNLGVEMNYKNARGKITLQYGTRTQVVPRNDLSPYRGQYKLADVYRYIGEAYTGYHFDKWYGINVDAGLFLSYIGLNSYYQEENWEYQSSYTSDNTPWFFNGLRVQIFPTKHLKIEPWIINGWQSYGRFNKNPGFGANITWNPTSNFKILTNDYYGTDAQGFSTRGRFHTDNSVLLRYFNSPTSPGVSKMAFSLTGDLGEEKGGGVSGFQSIPGSPSTPGKPSTPGSPAQYFASWMFYNRLWFARDHYAWTVGGGMMTNPGRYLVLYPTGQASPLPNPNNPTQLEGAFPFDTSVGTKFNAYDFSTNLDWMPNQSFLFRVEYVHRHASVPYFAGPGGVTSPDGYSTTALPANWRPDLVKSESRIILVLLYRL